MRNCLLLLISIFLFACTKDAYEKGEGEYSSMQADFVEAHANADKKVDYVVTDENQQLVLQSLYSPSWIDKADTVYRAVLYYKKDGETAEPVSMSRVSVPTLIPRDSIKGDVKMDPLTLESVWISKNKRYLNVGFYIKSGTTDDAEAIHKLAVVSDMLMKNDDNSHTLWLRLYHDQGGVPEYYSQHSYFSLSLKGLTADSIRFTVNTYKGEVVRTFSLK